MDWCYGGSGKRELGPWLAHRPACPSAMSNSGDLSSDAAALRLDPPGTKDVRNKSLPLYSSFSLGASATAVDSELSEQ